MTAGFLASPATSWGGVNVPTVLDHMLLGSSDLEEGIAFVMQHTGVTAAFGGVHPGRGTRNALLSLGDRHYLEIIGPDPAQPGAPDYDGLKKLTAPRLVGWAAHPGDLNAFAARLRNANLAFDGPTPGSRKRPDGRLLEWKTLNLHETRNGLLPFFIEWSPDTVHPSVDAPAGCKILRFEISGPDGVALERISKLLDLGVLITRGDKSQLRASIAGPGGKTVSLTS
jgi:hypothetical protein